jgi:hypothetical protein
MLTPYFQISVLNNFGSTNELSPYKEKLLSFFALPTLDWGLAFRPQVWLFHILSPEVAYSAYWLILMVSALASIYYLLKLSGIAKIHSLLGSGILFFSQFIQLWWTMNAGLFAFIAWTGVAMLVDVRPITRFILVFISVTVTLFSLLYLPFVMGGALVLGAYVLAVSPKRFADWRFLLPTGLGMAAGSALAVIYYWDLLILLKDTIYPGRPASGGGDVTAIQLLGHVLPYVTTAGIKQLGADGAVIGGIGGIAIGVIGSWLPLLMVVFAKRDDCLDALRQNVRFILIMGALLLFLLLWMSTDLVDGIFEITRLNYMKSGRALYGFGLGFLLLQLYLASKMTFQVSLPRFLVLVLIVVLGGVASVMLAVRSGQYSQSIFELTAADFDDYIVLAPIMLIAAWSWQRLRSGLTVSVTALPLLAISCIISASTFGTFNPVQSTRTIFTKPDSAVIRALDRAKTNSSKEIQALDGHIGAVLSGLGYRVINHVLLYPQLDFFRRLYPELDEATFMNVFNRYAHIGVEENLERPVTPQDDVIVLPSRKFRIVAWSQDCPLDLPSDFDATRYLQLYPDVAQAGMDAATHYLRYGCKEHREYR